MADRRTVSYAVYCQQQKRIMDLEDAIRNALTPLESEGTANVDYVRQVLRNALNAGADRA